jgi:hypothetical protein
MTVWLYRDIEHVNSASEPTSYIANSKLSKFAHAAMVTGVHMCSLAEWQTALHLQLSRLLKLWRAEKPIDA